MSFHTNVISWKSQHFYLTENELTYLLRCANGITPFIVDRILLSENQSALYTKDI